MHGHHAACGALPAAGPYLRLSRFQGGQADRLTHVQVPFTWTLSPLRPSKFSCEYLLLPPRSAPAAAPPGSRPRFCSDRRALLLIEAWLLPDGGYRSRASAPSISGLVDSAADFDFHDHRPDVLIDQHPLWLLVKLAVGHRNPATGSSRIASSAYQKWPTWSSRFRGMAQQSSHPCTREDPTNQRPYALRVYSTVDSHTWQTPWAVVQDGSHGEPTGRLPEHADARHAVRRVLQTTIKAARLRGRNKSRA
ncbi:hypothetical protein Bca4012_103138 [Brassica carinata]